MVNSLTVKKQLLVLASTYPRWLGDHEPGFVHELAKRLTNEFDVTVICPHAKDACEIEILDNVTVYRYRYAPAYLESLVNDGGIVNNLKNSPWKLLLLPSFFISQMLFISKILKIKKIDVIHAHWLIPQGLALAIISKFKSIPPYMVTSHGADLFALKGAVFNVLKKFVLRQSTASTVVSNVMKEKLLKLGVSDEKLSVLPMGINLQHFQKNDEIVRSKDELLFVGRLVEKKGLNNLINALPEIVKHKPDVFLTVIGFGPEEEKLKNQVKTLQLEEKVNFVGAITQDKLVNYYQRAAVFVAPFIEAKSGDQEGLGLVLIEALSCGCPVVVSDIPASNDVICNISSVSIFPSADVTKLAAAIIDKMSEPNISFYHRNEVDKQISQFDWKNISTQYIHKLKEVAG
jgi:glycosyltransferase involved in cell wall biosynthesis